MNTPEAIHHRSDMRDAAGTNRRTYRQNGQITGKNTGQDQYRRRTDPPENDHPKHYKTHHGPQQQPKKPNGHHIQSRE